MTEFDGDYVRYIAESRLDSHIDPTGQEAGVLVVYWRVMRQMARRLIALEEENGRAVADRAGGAGVLPGVAGDQG